MSNTIQDKIIIGNWKMNGDLNLIEKFSKSCISSNENNNLILSPSSVFLSDFIKLCPKINFAAQNCSSHENGSRTGEISAKMIKEIGCSHVIIGHSERREFNNESNLEIKNKIIMAHKSNLITIMCVGESEQDQLNSNSKDKIFSQLQESITKTSNPENLIIAYEPIWAIGTGKIPNNDEINEMALFISSSIKKIFLNLGLSFEKTFKILYGGSVSEKNIEELNKINSLSGFLVGGASLKELELSNMLNIIQP